MTFTDEESLLILFLDLLFWCWCCHEFLLDVSQSLLIMHEFYLVPHVNPIHLRVFPRHV